MRRSPLLPIFLIVVVDILGLTIMLPLLPFYAEHFGASPAVVGLLVSTYALCQLIAGPALGSLSGILGTTSLLPSVPPQPEGERPTAPAGPPQEEEAPVAPGGRRLRLFDWGTYAQYFRRPVLGGLLWEFFLFTFSFASFTGGFA